MVDPPADPSEPSARPAPAAPSERAEPFGEVDLAALRQRRSLKWRAYPPDVLPLWVAEMDFPLAEPVAAALHAAIARSDTGYCWAGDLPQTLAGYLTEEQGWPVDPARVTLVGDVLTGVAAALCGFTDPGDGVVVTPPVYPPFYSTIRDVAGRRVVEVPLVGSAAAGWALDLDALTTAFAAPRVRALLLCNPHNPTGTVFPAQDLRAVAVAAVAHGVTVVADEVHGPLTLAGSRFTAYQTLGADLAGGAVTVTSASKSWNLPGLKCAQVVTGSAQTQRAFTRDLPMEVTMSTGHLGVVAAEAALRHGRPWLLRVRRTIEHNRALLADLLAARLPAVGYVPPQATYLAWLDCRALGLGDDPAATFLERGRVALSSGPTFGTGGAGHARLNLATSPAVLAEAVARMAAAVG